MAHSSHSNQNPVNIIVVLAALQVLSATLFLNIESFYAINSLLFFLCGIGIAGFLLKLPNIKLSKPVVVSWQSAVKLLVILALLPLSYVFARQIMDGTPLQKEYADMLPIMKTMGTRFVSGDINSVYSPIPEIWGGVQPIYLPGMWLPFTSSLLFQFDMRWVTVGGIWLAVMLFIVPGLWKKSVVYVLPILSVLILLVWFHFEETNNVIRLTEEGVVFFYHTLLVLAIVSGNPWLTGLAAALCLLSRYANIGWVPFALTYLLYTKQYKYLAKSFATGIITAGLLLIPFGTRPLMLHLRLPSQYVAHARRIWEESPEFFTHSLGMAKFFGPGNTGLLHTILLASVFIIPLVFFFAIKRKKIAPAIALLSGLQLSITFFYNFLDVSYLYLYYTPVFVSLAIMFFVVQWRHAE